MIKGYGHSIMKRVWRRIKLSSENIKSEDGPRPVGVEPGSWPPIPPGPGPDRPPDPMAPPTPIRPFCVAILRASTIAAASGPYEL